MFEDNEPWPIKCVSCAKEFEQPVRWLETNNAVRCPLCKVTNKYSNEEFLGHSLRRSVACLIPMGTWSASTTARKH
jgi:hypothetical protein